jgi:iron complex outermembrane recepter protein
MWCDPRGAATDQAGLQVSRRASLRRRLALAAAALLVIELVAAYMVSLLTRYDLQGGMFDGLSATLGMTHVGTRKGDDENSFELPDYVGTDIGLHYRPLKHVEVGFFVEDLFDEDDVLSVFDIARTFPGAPRTSIGRLQRRF